VRVEQQLLLLLLLGPLVPDEPTTRRVRSGGRLLRFGWRLSGSDEFL
jgi:hypothetical protein